MKRKSSYKVTLMDGFLLVIGFALAFLDMSFLKNGIHAILPNINISMSSMIAFAIATIANTFALSWGFQNGVKSEKHVINKNTFIFFLAWLVFGGIYAYVEAFSIIKAAEAGTIDWAAQIGQCLILAVSYIFSGTSIQKSAREIWDADAVSCRQLEKTYKRLSRQISRKDSRIKYLLSVLDNYGQNYKILDEQYHKQLEAIKHAEQSVINEIVGKTTQENPSIDPSDAIATANLAREEFLKIKA